ncbi:MAG: hypothetical protein AAEJ04_06180 [Planctomycetota bacterium]
MLYQLSYTGTAADDIATPPGCPDRLSGVGETDVHRPIAVLQALADLLLPSSCLLCQEILDLPQQRPHLLLCQDCQRQLPRRSLLCCRCLQIPGDPAPRCPGCHSQTPYRPLVHISTHEGALRDLILAAKWGHRDDLSQPIAQELAKLVSAALQRQHSNKSGTAGRFTPCVVAIPRSLKRRLRHGAPLSQRLAIPLARLLGLQYNCAIFHQGSRPQTSLTATDRRRLPDTTFQLRKGGTWRKMPAPTAVILVDDVHTTGATLRAATRRLEKEGYPVWLWAVASISRSPRRPLNLPS